MDSIENTKILITGKCNDIYTRELHNELVIEKDLELITKIDNIKELINQLNILNFGIIFIILSIELYQEYYNALKKIKSNLRCIPILIIIAHGYEKEKKKDDDTKKDKDEKIKYKHTKETKEIMDSIGDPFFNFGGVACDATQVINIIEKILGKKITKPKSIPNFIISDDIDINGGKFDDLILPSLFIKPESRQTLITDLDIYKFNVKLKSEHSEHNNKNLSNFLSYLLKIQKVPIETITRFWIEYFNSNETGLKKRMNEEFLENIYYNYDTFIKGLYRGLDKNYLKSKYDTNLYRYEFININEFNKIQNSLKNKKNKLIYSKKFISFYSNCPNYSDFDKNSVPTILEIIKSEHQENYAYNIEISEKNKVIFFPYSCFIIDAIEEQEINGIFTTIKTIKLNYLGKYKQNIEKIIDDKIINKKQINDLLSNENSLFVKDIKDKFYKKDKYKDISDLIDAIDKEIKLIKLADNERQKTEIEITLAKEGIFISNEFFEKYNSTIDKIYFDDIIQENNTNDTKNLYPKKIKIIFKEEITDCEFMFYSCKNIREIKFMHFNTINITSMKSMFSNCYSLIKVNVDEFKTDNVIDMSCMFYQCKSLEELDLSNFKIDNVNTMSAMFFQCKNLENLKFDLNKKNTQKLTDISYMFKECKLIFDISKLDFAKIQHKEGLF